MISIIGATFPGLNDVGIDSLSVGEIKASTKSPEIHVGKLESILATKLPALLGQVGIALPDLHLDTVRAPRI